MFLPRSTPRDYHWLRSACSFLVVAVAIAFGNSPSIHCQADDVDRHIQPLLQKRCVRCHGGKEVNGEVNLKQTSTSPQLLANPSLLKELIEVIDSNAMPPEDEPQLEPGEREKLLQTLKGLLRQASSNQVSGPVQIRRLNRLQYNNAVRDLFQLKMDVFKLPEKLMTRNGNYLTKKSNQMPPRVNVSSLALNPRMGLEQVKSFPKDLRAAHGFDNQANQLTLSPLLLDAFLRLSVSIVESPDFNEQNVGLWNEFFVAPAADTDVSTEVRNRLERFMRRAFRRPVESETLQRYSDYALGKIESSKSFTSGMKKVASAILSSPMFLFRSEAEDGSDRQFVLASNLSFFLWGSGPDLELLQLAEDGQLAKPEVLDKTIERMLGDPKIERFLDTFPTQWMQLENVLAATPDPQKQKYFSLDKANPASLQMLLEPLLLFDAVFVENRPIIELIRPEFSYQSEFLKTWYTSDLKPPQIDTAQIVAENERNEARRQTLSSQLDKNKQERLAILEPAKARILAARKTDDSAQSPVDLKPYSAWEFDGDLKDSINSLHLQSHGKVAFNNGMVTLDKSYLLSEKLPFDLKAKSLEVWFTISDVNQRGGGVMGVQGPGDFFDTIVLGERKRQHWISGSNGFSRTLDFPESTPETTTDELLQLTMVYLEDGTTTLYRNGQPYGKPFRKGAATFPKEKTSIIFGLRHLPAGGNRYLRVNIDKARFYDRALTSEEVAASSSSSHLFVSEREILESLSDDEKSKAQQLAEAIEKAKADIAAVPAPRDPNASRQEVIQRFENDIRNKLRSKIFQRVAVTDPRYGGVITNAAMLSMTSGPKRTHPIARGAWIIEVVFNDPPPPPPNDVPPLNEDDGGDKLTIREKFAKHRENPDCAGCHARLDPLGFALENFDITGRWRDNYENGRKVDSSGAMLKKYEFGGIVEFKDALVKEEKRFAKAFTAHLLRFAQAKELSPFDLLTVENIVNRAEAENYRLKSLIREVILSKSFQPEPSQK